MRTRVPWLPQELGPAARVSPDAPADGMTGTTVFLLASLLFDLPTIGERPFHWLERLAQRAESRMIVTQRPFHRMAC